MRPLESKDVLPPVYIGRSIRDASNVVLTLTLDILDRNGRFWISGQPNHSFMASFPKI